MDHVLNQRMKELFLFPFQDCKLLTRNKNRKLWEVVSHMLNYIGLILKGLITINSMTWLVKYNVG